ncbi:MAG TPA: hypothetical protein VHT51_04350 [Micropepsaceae bacterium]|jgi:hypothetical protein|nr:hypothetical protein [Micropepsaceae bacterium]
MSDEPQSYFRQLAALLDKDTTPKEPQYYEALGRFVTSYARAEASIHLLVRSMSGLHDEKARVIFAGMRLGDLIDRARLIFRLEMQTTLYALKPPRSQTEYDDMDSCLIQLQAISDVRGELVHRVVTFIENSFHVSNTLTAKAIPHIESRSVTLPDLEAMTFDCGTIFLRLNWIANPGLFENKDGEFREFLQWPWRYKYVAPNPQKKSGQKQQKGHKGRQRPPEPSQS